MCASVSSSILHLLVADSKYVETSARSATLRWVSARSFSEPGPGDGGGDGVYSPKIS